MIRLMLKKENRYINLDTSSLRMTGRRGFNVAPQSRLVQLSGIKPERYTNRPGGVFLDGNADSERLVDSSMTRILEFFIYGLGLTLVSLGLYDVFSKRNEEQYG